MDGRGCWLAVDSAPSGLDRSIAELDAEPDAAGDERVSFGSVFDPASVVAAFRPPCYAMFYGG